jgi:hypothetical protein
MITKSQLVLLEALKASLFNLDPNYPSDTNWNEVKFEANAQTVLGLIKDKIPVNDEASEQCKAMYMRIMHEQNSILSIFDTANLPCVILKGCAAAIYYPKPYLRTMGDIDVLVQRDRFIEALKLIESNGYVYVHDENKDERLSENARELAYTKNGISIEIHKRFSSRGVDVDDFLEAAMNRREYYVLNGYRFPMLPGPENGLVLIGHINKHLKSNVLGLRQIIDWAMYVHSESEKSYWNTQFVPLVEKAGFLTLAAYVTRMCYKYLGLTYDVDFGVDIDDSLVDKLLEIVLTDGNFGRRTIADKTLDEKRMLSASYGIKRDGFFTYFIGVGLDNSAFCRKHSSLKVFPFMYGFFRQLFRGVRLMFKNKGFGKKMSEGQKLYEDHAKRQELYHMIGVRTGTEKSS